MSEKNQVAARPAVFALRTNTAQSDYTIVDITTIATRFKRKKETSKQ